MSVCLRSAVVDIDLTVLALDLCEAARSSVCSSCKSLSLMRGQRILQSMQSRFGGKQFQTDCASTGTDSDIQTQRVQINVDEELPFAGWHVWPCHPLSRRSPQFRQAKSQCAVLHEVWWRPESMEAEQPGARDGCESHTHTASRRRKGDQGE